MQYPPEVGLPLILGRCVLSALEALEAWSRRPTHFYFHEDAHRCAVNKRLAKDEARRVASNFAKLPELLGKGRPQALDRRRAERSTQIGETSRARKRPTR